MKTVLYASDLYPDLTVERDVLGPEANIIVRNVPTLMALDDADCMAADGLMLFRLRARAEEIRRFPNLQVIVRMAVGTDLIDRTQAAAQGIMVCNVPDYGTTEVADHAMALVLALRRGLLLHNDAQRGPEPAAWAVIETPLVRRLDVQTFGIVGLGRIGTAVALRAKAFGFRVVFFDPNVTNGQNRALGIERVRSLDALLAQSDVLSIHCPLTSETRGLVGARELALLPAGAIVVNTARGPIVDIDALGELMHVGRIAGAGLDVVPIEPPVEPVPMLHRAYRDHAPWLRGRLIVTPHSAFHSPEAWQDIRRLGAETMAAALFSTHPQNVIQPDGC